MRRLVWGIAFIFCVQLAFQLAMLAERTQTDYASLETQLTRPLDNTAPDPLDDLNTDLWFPPARVRPAVQVASTRRNAYAAPTAVSKAKTLQRDQATTFKTVVITYDRSGALSDADAATAIKKPAKPGTDRRSFIARVVTKPVDWIKAVASKLN